MIRGLHKAILRIRPALVADWVKAVIRVRRVKVTAAGSMFLVDPISRFGRQLLDEGTYEPDLISLLERTLRPGDTFIDVGASEGFFSVLASRLVGDGRVVAVEPQARSVNVLEANLSLNSCTNVLVQRSAVVDTRRPVTLSTGPSSNPGASGLYHRRFGARATVVEGLPLDFVVERLGLAHVRVIKIDAEGAELLVVQGARRTLAQGMVDVLSIDLHHGVGEDPHGRFATIDRYLADLGYERSEEESLLVYRRH